MTWSLPTPDDRVEWSLWTSANDSSSAALKEEFKEAMAALSQHQYFTPYYQVGRKEGRERRRGGRPGGRRRNGAERPAIASRYFNIFPLLQCPLLSFQGLRRCRLQLREFPGPLRLPLHEPRPLLHAGSGQGPLPRLLGEGHRHREPPVRAPPCPLRPSASVWGGLCMSIGVILASFWLFL